MGLFDFVGSLAGGILGAKSADRANDRSVDAAKNGIQWRVADAEKAGVHPLYALGASTASPSFQSVGDFGVGSALQGLGQDIDRAIEAPQTSRERDKNQLNSIILNDLKVQEAQLSLESQRLQNDLLRSQLRRANQPAQPPAISHGSQLMDGQGDSRVSIHPLPLNATAPSAPFSEPSPVSDVGFARLQSGALAPIPSSDVKTRIEDTLVPDFAWGVRNNVLPYLGGSSSKPPRSMLPEGSTDWWWDGRQAAWVPNHGRDSFTGSLNYWLGRR